MRLVAQTVLFYPREERNNTVDKPFNRRTTISNADWDTFLCLMEANIQSMLHDKKDRIDEDVVIRDLDDSALLRLREAQSKIGKLRQAILDEKEGKEIPMTVAMICSCPIHLRHLEEAGVVTLADLLYCDPLKLRSVLHAAEAEAGNVRHHYLYSLTWFRLHQISQDIADRVWRRE